MKIWVVCYPRTAVSLSAELPEGEEAWDLMSGRTGCRVDSMQVLCAIDSELKKTALQEMMCALKPTDENIEFMRRVNEIDP